MMRWHDGQWDNGAGALGVMAVGGLLLVLLLAGIGVLVWALTRGRAGVRAGGRGGVGPAPATGPVPQAGPARPTPLEILDERLARGELDLDTYRATREALNRRDATPPTS